MFIRSLLLAMVATPFIAMAAPVQEKLPGLYFSHGDWELVCDNTGTCRAAGYQPGERGPAASVLLTRKAGPNQKVSGQLLIGEAADNASRARPAVLRLTLRIDERNAGAVTAGATPADLAPQLVQALLGALPRTASIEWTAGTQRWLLSGKGAAAVLLKMDEFQGRIGTRGALIKPGHGAETAVLKASPMPTVHAARWVDNRPADARLATEQSERLRQALRATLGDQDYCPDLQDGDVDPLAVQRLSANRLLVSTRCWSGSYNINDGYWVIDDTPQFHPVLVTTAGSDMEEPNITASHKARGIGDCRSSDTWTWDGHNFIHTASSSTGMCKLVAAGGAWELPRIVTAVRAPR